MRGAHVALAIALLGIAAPAAAQSVQKGGADTQESSPPGVFGPFDDVRQRAADAGVTLSARYISEVGVNATGGKANRATETGQADVGAKLDLDQLAGLTGGTLNAVITWRRGRLLDTVAGTDTLQQTEEVYGRGQTWRLTRLWYQQALGRASIKLGRSNVGEDFASFSCDFMNLTFCGAQPGNVVGNYWFNWPVSQWMARAKVSIGKGYVQLGAYEVNPLNLRKTFTVGYFHGATGVLFPVEAAWKRKPGGLPGMYRIGAWYDTSHADDVVLDEHSGLAINTGLEPLRRNGRWGGWAVLRQQVSGSANQDGTVRGLSVFGRVTQADRRTSRLDRQIVLGVFYEGLAVTAPDDVVGVALGSTHVNGRIAAAEGIADQPVQRSEYVGEIFYSIHPTPGLIVRPNVQYIVDPGGRRGRTSVLILGVKTAISL